MLLFFDFQILIMRIIFMGTPDFAVPSLDILVKNGFDVVAVITATDKYGGRGGKKLIESAVKKYAVAQDIPVLQPKNLKNEEFQDELRTYKANLQIVVAFRMLPVAVWDMPPLGTMNLHGSLLPKYRGAAPINWAVINGEKETGVTTFFLKHKIDTGDILMQEKLAIESNDTAGTVHDKMMELGAEVVLKSVQKIQSKDYELKAQDDLLVTKAPKIFHDTCEVNFDQPTQKVYDFIRGLSPYPTAWTTIDGLEVKIYEVEKEAIGTDEEPGTIKTDGKKYLKIATQDGYIELKSIKMQGKRRMSIKDFLNGYQLTARP